MDINPLFLGVVPLVMGLVSLSKNYIDAYWSPITSLVLGVAGAFVVYFGQPLPEVSAAETLISGVMMGLMASGAYSSVKTMAKTQ